MILAFVAGPALAVRPTEGGLWSFAADDEVVTYDEPTGTLRAHYSIAGPNDVDLTDADADGVPDFVALALQDGLDALALYASLGLRMPVAESEFGLEDLGGSPALDVYFIDFGGQADGMFSAEACTQAGQPPVHCSGYLVVENDYAGYGYGSDAEALSVVIPHELFHGVQYAYTDELDVWASEGTAMWAEQLFDPESRDFRSFASAYFDEPTRSIDDPPLGPVPAFAYATGLWFDFLTTRHDESLMVDLLEAWEAGESDLTTEMLDTLVARGDTVSDAWISFATWVLATGPNAGGLDGFAYADDLPGPVLEQADDVIDDENRFYPLATTYYRVHHGGGELWFGLDEPAPGLYFSVHPTADGTKDSPVLDAVAGFWADDPAPRSLGDLPQGHYFLWGSQPEDGDQSIQVRFCAGSEDAVRECFSPAVTDTGSPPAEEGEGCGCSSTGGGGLAALAVSALLVRRRRRS